MKILGIDDDEEINELLKVVLKAEGYNYTNVNNGKEGLQLIREKKFDVVLLDIAMPEFSGIDVVNALLKEDLLKKQTVIFFTASAIPEEIIEKMLSQGVHTCLRKPVELDTLLGTLERLS